MEGVKWELENHSSCGNQSKIEVEMRAGHESPDDEHAVEGQRQLQCPAAQNSSFGLQD